MFDQQVIDVVLNNDPEYPATREEIEAMLDDDMCWTEVLGRIVYFWHHLHVWDVLPASETKVDLVTVDGVLRSGLAYGDLIGPDDLLLKLVVGAGKSISVREAATGEIFDIAWQKE
jgi:hypothetical protein